MVEVETRHRPDEAAEALAAAVRFVVFDVDGVLTDGRLILGDDGAEYKAFHVRDGHGIRQLLGAGIEVAVISGRDTPVVAARMAELGVTQVFQGCGDKLAVFETALHALGLSPEQAACVGDDVVDLPLLRRAGFAVAVSDAHALVRAHADWTTPSCGGRGAVRELCDFILQAQGRLEAVNRRYLQAGA